MTVRMRRKRRTFEGQPVGRLAEALAKRLAGNAVVEWAAASGQVLREHYTFDTENLGRFFDLTLAQAEANRAKAQEEGG